MCLSCDQFFNSNTQDEAWTLIPVMCTHVHVVGRAHNTFTPYPSSCCRFIFCRRFLLCHPSIYPSFFTASSFSRFLSNSRLWHIYAISSARRCMYREKVGAPSWPRSMPAFSKLASKEKKDEGGEGGGSFMPWLLLMLLQPAQRHRQRQQQ